MARSTAFLILAFLLLLHCFCLLSAAGKPDNGVPVNAGANVNNDFANAAGGDAFADAGKKNQHGGSKKHRSLSKTRRKVSSGKHAGSGQSFSVGPAFGIGPAIGIGPVLGSRIPYVKINKAGSRP